MTKSFRILLILFLLITDCNSANNYIRNYVFEWLYIDKNIAFNYLEKSINVGAPIADSAFILGSLFLDNSIFEKNLKLADHYLTLAANLNHPGAINSIGDGYYIGDIREKNTKEALKWYEKAANLGYGPSQFNAGIILMRSSNCEKDLKKSIFWLDKASKNQDDLGDMTKNALKYKEVAKNKLKEVKKASKNHVN